MFELTVVSNTPLNSVQDIDTVATLFLHQVGYLPKGYDPKTDVQSVRQSVPYKLFIHCFVRRPEKLWTIDELITVLGTSRPTVYRHLNKLRSLDLIENVSIDSEDGARRAYRLRYGNLSKAWSFVEAHVKVAMDSYRKTADHLSELARRERRRVDEVAEAVPAAPAAPTP